MRARPSVILVVFAIVAVAGGMMLRAGSADGQAQTERRPLMVNEIRDWCPLVGTATECDDASYATLADGAIRAIFNYDPETGELTETTDFARGCTKGMAIPPDVQGWAYTVADGTARVLLLAEVTSETAVCELVASR